MSWTQASARVFRELKAAGAFSERTRRDGITEIVCGECVGFALVRSRAEGRLGTQRDRQNAESHAHHWHHAAWLRAVDAEINKRLGLR